MMTTKMKKLKIKVGDLVRRRADEFSHQIGVVRSVGRMGSVSVMLLCGRPATFNRGSLEVVSEGG